MGIFGWSLPPGCGTLPGEEEEMCGVCGGDPELPDDKDGHCLCPECTVCGSYGDPYCYEAGHLEKTQAQVEQLQRLEEEWASDHDYEPCPDIDDLTEEDIL